MKNKLTIFGALLLAGSIASAAQPNLDNLFDRGQKVPFDDLVPQNETSPSKPIIPIIILGSNRDVTRQDVTRQGPQFADLRLEINNSWLQRTTRLDINPNGQVSIRISRQATETQVINAAIPADEIKELQALWTAAQLPAGDRFLGHVVPDAPIFTLSYRSCMDGAQLCSGGALHGSMVASAWGEQGTAVQPLVEKLQAILTRFQAQ